MKNIDKSLANEVHAQVWKRDEGKPCIICDEPLNGIIDVCHFIKRGKSQFLKYHLCNNNLGHRTCNEAEERDEKLHAKHAVNIQKKYGLEMYAMLISMKNQNIKFGRFEKADYLKEIRK